MSRCPDFSCQHEHVRRAGESITHMQWRRHYRTVGGLQFRSLIIKSINALNRQTLAI